MTPNLCSLECRNLRSFAFYANVVRPVRQGKGAFPAFFLGHIFLFQKNGKPLVGGLPFLQRLYKIFYSTSNA